MKKLILLLCLLIPTTSYCQTTYSGKIGFAYSDGQNPLTFYNPIPGIFLPRPTNTTYGGVLAQSTYNTIVGLGSVANLNTIGDTSKYLRSDGTWQVVTGGSGTYTLPNATSTALGGIQVGSNLTILNGILSLTSNNVLSALGTQSITASVLAVGSSLANLNSPGGTSQFLRADGTWQTISGGGSGSGGWFQSLIPTSTNTLPSLSNNYSTGSTGGAILIVNGISYTDHDNNSCFSILSSVITWNSTICGFSINTSDKVSISYTGQSGSGGTYSLPYATSSILGGVLAQSSYNSSVGLGSAANYATGTSGAVVPLLSGTNSWTGTQVFQNSISASSFIMLDIAPYANNHRLNIVTLQSVSNDYATVNINRTSGVSGGTDGSINAALRIQNSIDNSGAYDAVTNPYGKGSGYDGKPYEWGLSVMTNNARTFSSGGYKGMNGAAVFFGYRQSASAGGTWGTNTIARDWPGLSDPTEVLIASENDVMADGTDANNVRIGISSIIKSTSSTDLVPGGYGVGAYAFTAVPDPGYGAITSGAWYAKWKKGFYAAGPMDVAIDVADTSGPTATTPYSTPVALRINQDQIISLEKDDSKSIRYSSSKSAMCYQTGGMDTFCNDNSGNFGFGSPAFITSIAGYTWGRISNVTNGGALQVDDGTVIGTIRGGNGMVHVGADSLHDLGLYSNSSLVMRFYSTYANLANPLQIASSTIAALIANTPCNSTTVNTQSWINNGIASPAYHQTVSTTGGASLPVYCIYNGTSYSWVY